jgi:cystathionine gamma-synthase/methionine-gamma-lyase
MASPDLYGATHSILRRLFGDLGVNVRFVDTDDIDRVEQVLLETQAVALIVETISNPLLKVADLPALAELTRRHHTRLLVDNTFASPYLCSPLRYGADFVVHSATKFIAGHGDTMAGVVVTTAEMRQQLYELNKLVGSVLGPFEAWLALRGLKTLPLRMRQQCANAQQIAEWLAAQPGVRQVNYPGLSSCPQFVIASHLFAGRGYGGVLSFEIAGADRATAFRFMERLALCLPATTLGDVYTLVLHPATSSHRSLSADERERLGISEGLVRLSAGIEDSEDIIADLEQALAALD